MIPIHILCTKALIILFSAEILFSTMLPSRWAKFGPLLASLIHVADEILCNVLMMDNAELAAEVQNCCPELAVLGPMKPASSPHWLHELQWRARCKAYAVGF